jgi:hypothetical protein
VITFPFYEKGYAVLKECVPDDLLSLDLIKKAANLTADYFFQSLGIDVTQEGITVQAISDSFEAKIEASVEMAPLIDYLKKIPSLHNKTLMTTLVYAETFVPWVLTKFNYNHTQVDTYIKMIYSAEAQYEIIEDCIDQHGKIPSYASALIPSLSLTVITNLARLIENPIKAIELFSSYHNDYILAELSSNGRKIEEARNLWFNSKQIYDKAAPAKLLFVTPLFTRNKIDLVPTYEQINDHFTLYLQLLDDISDLRDDSLAERNGIALGLVDWLMQAKDYSFDKAMESVSVGTGFRIIINRAISELHKIIELALEKNDLLIVYAAYIRINKLNKFIVLQDTLLCKS